MYMIYNTFNFVIEATLVVVSSCYQLVSLKFVSIQFSKQGNKDALWH